MIIIIIIIIIITSYYYYYYCDKCIWNKLYMRTAEIKSNEEWSTQLWLQFMQLRKKPEKNSTLQRDLNPWPRDTGIQHQWLHSLVG